MVVGRKAARRIEREAYGCDLASKRPWVYDRLVVGDLDAVPEVGPLASALEWMRLSGEA